VPGELLELMIKVRSNIDLPGLPVEAGKAHGDGRKYQITPVCHAGQVVAHEKTVLDRTAT
jgi:hypothetical protein